MGEFVDKTKGTANEAIGNVKQGVGAATGSDYVEKEGEQQEAKGDLQKAKGDVEGAMGNDI